MQTVVIGSSGYVGRNLLRHLALANVNAVGLTRPAFDLLAPGCWKAAWPDAPVDCAVHAAGLNVGAHEALNAVNAASAAPLAEFLGEMGVKKLIYISTGRVYGAVNRPATTDLPAVPVAPYERSKLVAEEALRTRFGGVFAVARLYYPFGRDQDPARFIPRMIDAVRNGRPIVCRPDGGPRLSVTHIDDICHALTEDFIVADPPAIANLASGQIISIRDLAERISSHIGVRAVFETTGTSLDEVSETYPGMNKALDLDELIEAGA